MSFSFPNKKLDHVAIGVADIDLLYSVATWTQTTYDLHIQSAQML
jgi:hypothetical protein